MEEELFIYQLPTGDRVNLTNATDVSRMLWLTYNSDAERVEPNQEEITLDTSIFGVPGGIQPVESPDYYPGIGPQPYDQFDLNTMLEQLTSSKIKQYDKETPSDITMVDAIFGASPQDTEFAKISGITDDITNNAELRSAIINAALNPKVEKEDYIRTGVEGESIYEGLGLDPEFELYSQKDVGGFMRQPSIKKALDAKLITKKDLALGMYPGYTGWVESMGNNIDEGPSGIKLPNGKELTNREVFKIMWQNDMPFNTDVERVKREGRRKVNRFVLKTPKQIESIIDAEKLNQPYIFEEYAIDDEFIDSIFNTKALSRDKDFNIKDFNGFINHRGHREDIQNTIKRLEKYNPTQKQKGWEIIKLHYLNLYLNEQFTRDLKQQKLEWETKNPAKDADTEGIQFYLSEGNINPNMVKDWMRTETPYVYKTLEENQLKLETEYQNLLKTKGNVSTGDFLTKNGGNFWIGFWDDAIVPFSTFTMDILPGEWTDNVAENWRTNHLIKGLERGDQIRYGYKRGKILQFPEYGNIEYLVTDDNRIFDITNKIEATGFLNSDQQRDIIERTKKEGVQGGSTSSAGLAFEFSRVFGDLFFQVALTRGIGKLKSTIGGFTKGMGVLGQTKNFLKSLPVKSIVADAIIAQSTIGFVRGYEDTLLAAREAGINDQEARELASNASFQTGAWYALTAPISPQTKATNLIFGKPAKETIETALTIYKKKGWQGWNQFWKDQGKKFTTYEGFKGLVRGADLMQREGWKELFQENIQQWGETESIGVATNIRAGQQIVREDYNLEDFIQTSKLSFLAGMAMPGAGMTINSSRNRYRQFMGLDNVDRFNALAYMAFNEKELKSLLAKQVEDGLYTQEEADNLLQEVSLYKNTINDVPKSMDAKNAKNILEDIKELRDLENDKKNSPKGFTGYDNQIQALKDRINNTYYDAITSKDRAAILAAAKAGIAGNTVFEAFENEEQALEYLKGVIPRNRKTKNMDDKKFEEYLKKRFISNKTGAMFQQGDTNFALEFKWQAAKPGRAGKRLTQTAQHEFKHALWVKTIGEDYETQVLLGKALFNEISKMDLALDDDLDTSVLPKDFVNRFRSYYNRFLKAEEKLKIDLKNKVIDKAEYERRRNNLYGNTWEEALEIYSEAIGENLVKFDEDVAQRLKNTWRRAMQFIGATDFEFDSGRAVFNMIRDYNAAIKSGTLKWNRAFKKMGTKGAKVDKKALEKEKQELETTTSEKLAEKEKRKEEKLRKEITVLKEEIDKRRKATAKTKKTKPGSADEPQGFDTKYSLIPDQKYDPKAFGEKIDNYYDADLFTTNTGIDTVAYDIIFDYEAIITNKVESLYSNLPSVLVDEIVFGTQEELLKHIRNFNKTFLKERDKYKESLYKKGLSKSEIEERLKTQDEQGYKITTGEEKGEIIKENKSLYGWINSQLVNKIKQALKRPGITTKKYTKEYDPRTMGTIDEDTAEEQKQEWEQNQSKLVSFLRDPLFGFVNEDGTEVIIDVVPLGGRTISGINDPTLAVNQRLKTAEDPDVINDLERQKRNIERGLELENKSNLTNEEVKELEKLRGFQAYDLGSGRVIKTYEAYTLPMNPVKMIIKAVEEQILRAPNIATLHFRNFKNKFESFIFPLARYMTFKNQGDLDFFMYNNWELIYKVINNPYDPVTGESTYAAKKIPTILREFDEQGRPTKNKKITRALFLQAYFGKNKAEEIINKYNENPESEIKQLRSYPVELSEKADKTMGEIGPTGFFDRRTSLMQLFGDVLILQEARNSLRSERFLNQIAEKNPILYEELKQDNIIAEVIDNMATGKSDSVKFSINNNLSPLFKGRTLDQQIAIANVAQQAFINSDLRSRDQEIKYSIKFDVPNLGNLNDKAIALYLINKMSQGYNNFTFRNAKNSTGKITSKILNEGDVKFSRKEDYNFDEYSNNLSDALNQILAETGNIDPKKQIEKAEVLGKYGLGSDKGQWWRSGGLLSAKDMDILRLMELMATGKGKKGEQQKKWFREKVFDVYMKGNFELKTAKVKTVEAWTQLWKNSPGLKGKLTSPIKGMKTFTYGDAVRVYMWSKGWAKGNKRIPGLSMPQKFRLIAIVNKDKELREFANKASQISKQPNGWIEPYEGWTSRTISSEIKNNLVEAERTKYLAKFIQNVDLIFTDANLNKIQAIYGNAMRVSIEDNLERMKYGQQQISKRNNPEDIGHAFMDYLNNTIGVTMFFNMRSAALQTISFMNFLNTTDNNPLAAGKAILNVPQFMEDFNTLWNSSYLKDRRQGMLNSLQEQEIADLATKFEYSNSMEYMNALLSYLLKIGFGPTRVVDSFAIAFGGTTFYRNRINTYKKDGFTEEEAIKKAEFDWFVLAEDTQQSGDPSKISFNQARNLGRLMLAFQNTPLQYGRIMKSKAMDIAKGRGNLLHNLGVISYYGGLQYAIFAFLQNALMATMWDEEEKELPTEKYNKNWNRFANGWVDSTLKGQGIYGAFISWIKNIILTTIRMGKDDKAIYKEGDFVLSLSEGIVPAAIISRKAVQAYRTYTWNQQEINDILALEKGADKILKNANLIKALLFGFEAATQVPVARLYIKSENLKNAFDSDFEMWQRILFFLGYSTWNLGLNIEDGNGRRGRTGPLDFGPNLDFKGLEFKPKLNF
tara:strand:- start:616 stop:8517 length:7902 start_codon:yes stop_codon:yes gene_type:complete